MTLAAGATTTRAMRLTLVAMTLANSMILVDQTAVPLASPDVVDGLGGDVANAQWIMTANILPLAAFMVLGGRLGDLLGLRRVFLTGAVVFGLSTVAAGTAQDMTWMIVARTVQGAGAALMMPTAVAITSATWPRERRGYALGVLAGGAAFFAALGPVLGGLLTSISWRLVFLINVPLAVAVIVLTVSSTPALRGSGRGARIDWVGAVVFALAIVALVFGLTAGQPDGWLSPATVVPLAASVALFAVFVWVELHVSTPLVELRLLRQRQFLAANISQLLAGALELGLGFLLPFYLLLVIGVGPVLAGIALIPGTIPIILAGPLAGRLYDRYGGRWPLVVGFLVLAASGLALGLGTSQADVWALLPGLVLQGLGLGVVLTVNDPVGLDAVDEDDQGMAAGVLNTTEQLGGALGIAVLSALELGYYFDRLYGRLAEEQVDVTPDRVATVHNFIVEAEEKGLRNVARSPVVDRVYDDLVQSHLEAFRLTFFASSVVGLLGAIACLLLLGGRRSAGGHPPIFSRRSRWVATNVGRSPAVSRRPDGTTPAA